MAITFYDIKIDGSREVTQRDVDEMQAVVSAYGQMREYLARIHGELQSRLETIRSRFEVNEAVQQAMDATDATEPKEGPTPA